VAIGHIERMISVYFISTDESFLPEGGTAGLRYYIIENGRWKRSDDLERGKLLVRSEEEWRERLDAIVNRNLFWVTLVLVIASAFWIAPLALIAGNTPALARPIIILIILLVGLTIGIIPPLHYFQKRLTKKSPAVGLYERGVQLTINLFVPYHEIDRVAVIRKNVRMYPQYQRTPLPGIKIPAWWMIGKEILGEEGLAELERRVKGIVVGDEEPPKLVIYGRRI
jgi:hypothetical protein